MDNKLISTEIKELIDLIKEIGDYELSNKAHVILNRRRDLLFSFHVDSDYGIQIDDIVVNSLKTIINNYMETKELKITPPEGYEIDKENSTFDCIKFRPVIKRWRDDTDKIVSGYYITDCAQIELMSCANSEYNYNVFATKKQAKSALAMARISQIMVDDPRFGGVVIDEEWVKHGITKWTIERCDNKIITTYRHGTYTFLAFHTPKQRDLFLAENEDLVKDYLMID